MSGSYELNHNNIDKGKYDVNRNGTHHTPAPQPPPTHPPPAYNGHVTHQPQPQPHSYPVQPPLQPPPQQPLPQQQMVNNNNNNNNIVSTNTVVVNQPGAGNTDRLLLIKKSQLRSRSWNSGICGCFNDFFGCVFGVFCLPCLMIRLANRMNECAFVTCLTPGGLATLRTQLRVMGGIKGSICQDFLETAFCLPCVACQMSREMNDMEL